MVNSLIPMSRIDEMLDGFFGTRSWPLAPGNGRQIRHLPQADILEGEKDYLIRLDVPGATRENLEIHLEDQTLTLKAERELPAPENYQVRHKELPSKLIFERTFNLGREIDADHISAKLENGVLTVTLPKSATALPRRIEVK
jgi:HSP20 family molecular chaperone IbpA